mmetsp:Transcript_3443/g.8977  ORF Transcript_3443/g.8977 Transcript_3443/m.8977 type:complete len:285 (+) Transcript_3443:55-909(+)
MGMRCGLCSWWDSAVRLARVGCYCGFAGRRGLGEQLCGCGGEMVEFSQSFCGAAGCALPECAGYCCALGGIKGCVSRAWCLRCLALGGVHLHGAVVLLVVEFQLLLVIRPCFRDGSCHWGCGSRCTGWRGCSGGALLLLRPCRWLLLRLRPLRASVVRARTQGGSVSDLGCGMDCSGRWKWLLDWVGWWLGWRCVGTAPLGWCRGWRGLDLPARCRHGLAPLVSSVGAAGATDDVVVVGGQLQGEGVDWASGGSQGEGRWVGLPGLLSQAYRCASDLVVTRVVS